MVKSYLAIQQWDRWLSSFLGSRLLEAENKILLKLLKRVHGKHAVLMGVPKQYSLLEQSQILDRALITPLIVHNKTIRYIEGNWNKLPISSGSVDLVLIPHALEYVNNPRQVLSEACRIVKPEGSLVIFSFNPHSLWALSGPFNSFKEHMKGSFISANSMKEWLALSDFELIKQKSILFRPPVHHEKLFDHLKIIEWIGDKLYLPLGGVNVLLAKAKVIPLTPIRLNWKQQITGAKLTIPNPSVRNF